MDENITPLLPNDTFRFSCTPDVPCFNECCRDLNQFLTPYDILRLKNRLGLTSGLFLERYTAQHIGPESGLPIITLRANPGRELTCPFVTPTGCSVYEDRPSSCRAYPLVRVVTRSKATGRMNEQYLLLRESHCLGFDQEQVRTVAEWIEVQGLSIYNSMNDMLMEVISLKNRLRPGPLDSKARHLFYMACYDLDAYRKNIFEKGISKDLNLTSDIIKKVEKDDEALLKLGLQWIKDTLFGNPKLDT